MGKFGVVKKFGFISLAAVSTVTFAACGGSDSSKSDSSKSETSSSSERSSDRNQNQNQNQNQNNQNQNQQQQNQNNQNQNQNQQQQNQESSFPEIRIVSCQISGTTGSLVVTASSSSSGGNKGVTSVYVNTYNNEGASVRTDLSYLGSGTGNGDQWSSTRVAYGNGYERQMTIVARSSSGATKSADFEGSTSPCP